MSTRRFDFPRMLYLLINSGILMFLLAPIAIVIVFALSISAYVTPFLMGGTDVLTLPMLIYQQVGASFNLGFAGALGVILLAVSLVVVLAYNRVLSRFAGGEKMA